MFSDLVTGQRITVGTSKSRLEGSARKKMPKNYSVFTSTFNCAEASLESIEANLPDWIFLGHDIYAISVQECTCLDSLRKSILTYLNTHDTYEMRTSEIGSNDKRFGYHGFIGLTLFVRSSDLDNNYIEIIDSATNKLATGKDLVITTAENKGAVGLHLQIFDTNICFVGSHLPSDSKGITKLRKRNDSVDTILTQFVCAPEDAGFNLQLQHDHLVFMGDLNYRMECNEENTGDNYLTSTLELASEACVIEKSSLNAGGVEWFDRRYDLLRARSDPLFPDYVETGALNKARHLSTAAWEKALYLDELRMVMASGMTFYNFLEPLPTFPPSYKRETGLQGDCGDYTDMRRVIDGFVLCTHKGEEAANDAVVSVSRDSFTVEIFDKTNNETIEMTTNPLAKVALEARLANGEKELFSERVLSEKRGSDKVDRKVSSQTIFTRFGSMMEEKHRSFPTVKSTTQGKVLSAKVKKIKKNERPPSYTDRILIHSLDYYRTCIQNVRYEACDRMACSDHKPVSMVFNLEVNAACRTVEKARNGTVMLFELMIADMHIEFMSPKDISSSVKAIREKINNTDFSQIVESFFTIDINPQKTSKKSAVASGCVNEILEKVQVVFPLPTKDPVIHWKKRHQLNKVFRSEYAFNPILADINRALHVDGHSCSPDELESIMDLVSDFSWHADSAITDDLRSMNTSTVHRLACVSPTSGVQVLIKLVSKDDKVIGQTNVCLNRLLDVYRDDASTDLEKGKGGAVRSSLGAAASYAKRVSLDVLHIGAPGKMSTPTDNSSDEWLSISSEVINAGHLAGTLTAKYKLVPIVDVTSSSRAELHGSSQRESQNLVTL